MNHPNIVKVYELYIDELKGCIYSVMELVDGKELFIALQELGSYTGKFELTS